MNSIDKLLKALPYTRSLFSDSEIQRLNKKFEIFTDANLTKEKSVQRLSIVNQYDNYMEFSALGGKIPDMYYNQLMYSQTSDDKKRRLVDYRTMSQYPEVESALREICDEMFNRDDQGEIIKSKLVGNYNDEVISIIEKEFQKFLNIFRIEDKGWKHAYEFITEGELFFENVVSLKKPELGIIGVTKIANERIDPLYYDLDNELIDCFILRAKMQYQYPYQWGKFSHQTSYGRNNQQEIMFLNDKQVTYFANDTWESEGKKYRIPHLANAHRPYRQLSLIEDATIIYMLVRAPERLVFNIDTGGLPPTKAEQYMKRLMTQFWTKKTIGTDGRVENTYDPVSMIENFYFAKPREGQGSTVESIGGGNASPDNLEILNFFVQKLYKSLHVPLGRLNSETAFTDGESITREELRFAKFIISVQKLWANALKKAFIVHLKLKGRKTFETAKKLGIDEVNIPQPTKSDKTHSFKLSSLVTHEHFNDKHWNYYDVVNEEINRVIEEQISQLETKKEILLEKLYNIDDRLKEVETRSVIVEGAEDVESEINAIDEVHAINLEGEQIASELDTFTQNIEKLKEMKDDNTSWWDQYDLKEEDIQIKFNEPSQFFALREQQIFQLRYDNFNNMSQNDLISNTFAQKVYLDWSDNEILANMEFLRKDAAFRWELAQIEQNGPDFREKALEEMQASMEGGGQFEGLGAGGGGGGISLPSGGGGGGMGSTSPGDTNLPGFGQPPAGEGPNATGGQAGTPPLPPSNNQAEGETNTTTAKESYDHKKFINDNMAMLLESSRRRGTLDSDRKFLEKMRVLLEH